jgi:hypothetical protein
VGLRKKIVGNSPLHLPIKVDKLPQVTWNEQINDRTGKGSQGDSLQGFKKIKIKQWKVLI